ncbi:G2/mitotic-specific cyclin C13-1-like protein [Tanacetum coccineum]
MALEQLCGYKLSDLRECVQVLHDLQLSKRATALVAIREKYKQQKSEAYHSSEIDSGSMFCCMIRVE